MDDCTVGLNEMARQCGVSHMTILRAVERGEMPRNADGTFNLMEALTAWEKRQNKPYNRGGRPRKDGKPNKAGQVSPQPRQKASIEHIAELRKIEQMGAKAVNDGIKRAQLAELTYRGKLTRLEYLHRKGELLLKVDVEERAGAIASKSLAKLNALPPRISGMCEGRTEKEIEATITAELTGIIEDLEADIKKMFA